MSSYFRRLKTPRTDGFDPWHFHHAYTGIIIIIIGFCLLFADLTRGFVYGLLSVGLWCVVDDIVQHSIQWYQRKRTGKYDVVSFLHWFFEQFLGEEYRQ